jgi:hypothetical protein
VFKSCFEERVHGTLRIYFLSEKEGGGRLVVAVGLTLREVSASRVIGWHIRNSIF